MSGSTARVEPEHRAVGLLERDPHRHGTGGRVDQRAEGARGQDGGAERGIENRWLRRGESTEGRSLGTRYHRHNGYASSRSALSRLRVAGSPAEKDAASTNTTAR